MGLLYKYFLQCKYIDKETVYTTATMDTHHGNKVTVREMEVILDFCNRVFNIISLMSTPVFLPD